MKISRIVPAVMTAFFILCINLRANCEESTLSPFFDKCMPKVQDYFQDFLKYQAAVRFLLQNARLIAKRALDSVEAQGNTTKSLIDTLKNGAQEDGKKLKDIIQGSWETVKDLQRDLEYARNRENYPPVGFIYTQYHLDKSPLALWPAAVWFHASKEYAGLFFRAEGGGSEPFGAVQANNTRTVTEVGHMYQLENGKYECIGRKGFHCWDPIGTSTGFEAKSEWGIYLGFKATVGEVRPVNAAVRLWRRMR